MLDILVVLGIGFIWFLYKQRRKNSTTSTQHSTTVSGSGTGILGYIGVHNETTKQRLIDSARRGAILSLIFLVLLLVSVYVFVPEEALNFIIKFGPSTFLFFIGIIGFRSARSQCAEYNTWNLSYSLALLTGFVGVGLSLVSLYRILQ